MITRSCGMALEPSSAAATNFTWPGEAETGTDAVQFVKRFKPDLVLMDIGLPGLNGVETTAEILRYHPDCKIVILSMYDDENSVVSAIRSGARAFISEKSVGYGSAGSLAHGCPRRRVP